MTRAEHIVDTLLEDDSLDSLEGAEPWDYSQVFTPGSPQYQLYQLSNNPPKTKAEAHRLGVNWFVQGGRKYVFQPAAEEPPGYPKKSHTLATNRNLRRRSFGATDVYSTRERDWPTPSRRLYYKHADRALKQREQNLGGGI